MPTFDYGNPSAALTGILEWIEERVDLAHTATVEERHIKSLLWEPIDRPLMTFSAPVSESFAAYPYHEAFHDPAKMLVNELVGPYSAIGPSPSIVNSVMIKDDYPLQIRAFYGVGLMASLFGAKSKLVEDNFPWVEPIGQEALKRLVAQGVPDMNGGVSRRALDTMAYYKEALAPYPKCGHVIHITQPDLQGPFDIAAQLWGPDIFTAFYDCPYFLKELLDLLAETYVLACRRFAAESTEKTLQDDFIYLHFSINKGTCLLKNDSSTMLSPTMYTEFIRPVDEHVLEALGTGCIHWCGSGDHWRSELVETRGLAGIDWGDPPTTNLPAWAAALQEHRLPICRMELKADAFLKVAPTQLFPTGASFTIQVDSLEQAMAIIRKETSEISPEVDSHTYG